MDAPRSSATGVDVFSIARLWLVTTGQRVCASVESSAPMPSPVRRSQFLDRLQAVIANAMSIIAEIRRRADLTPFLHPCGTRDRPFDGTDR